MEANHDPYNAETRALFANPAHAGDLQDGHVRSALAEASESSAGARIQLAIGLVDGQIQKCRFRVFGCPHLIAASEWLCRTIEGGPVAGLADFRAADCIEPLGIPVEKTGHILLLEDAIRLLLEQLDTD